MEKFRGYGLPFIVAIVVVVLDVGCSFLIVSGFPKCLVSDFDLIDTCLGY